jgi:hypothetical protein
VLHLAASPELTSARDEVFSSFLEIFNNIERLINYLMEKGRDEAGWLGILAGILVWFFGVIGLFVVNLFADTYATKYFIEHPGSSIFYLGFLLALSLPVGLITYSYAKKQYTEEYLPWKNTLQKLKKTVTENKAEKASILEKTLQLIDQASVWLPNLMKYRSEEALTYGLVAFLLTALVSANSPIGMPIALLIGVMVWLYFRYEKRKETDQQIKELKAWRQKFEEGKGNFLKSV